MRINIAISGGPCTGKSVLAAALYAQLKIMGYDYDQIGEEKRKLGKEFGEFRSPFERFYMWRQQEREEVRSAALDGFITDYPLFHFYTQTLIYAQDDRDMLAVRELFRMCLEIKDRYQIIVLPEKPYEAIPYKKDSVRTSEEPNAREKHRNIQTFLEHFWPKKLIYVGSVPQEGISKIIQRRTELDPTKE